MLLYNLPAFADNDVDAFLNGVARANNLLKKVGTLIFSAPRALLAQPKTAEPDKILAAHVVLRDWNTGNFPRFTLPPTSSPASSAADTGFAKAYSKDDGILLRLRTRSELKKSGGLIGMSSGEICKRTLILDTERTSPEDSGPSGDEDEVEELLDFYGNDGDDEDEDGDEGEDEDEEESEDEGGDKDKQEDEEEPDIEPPPLPSKRKRPAEPSAPKKRVAFDLQKSVKNTRLQSKHALLNPGIKKPTLISKKQR